jgi:type I restriction enzyme S subunit
VRNYVDDTEHGVPFLTSSSMLLADFTHIDLLRKQDATSPRLAHLRLDVGMTLISCSGTIGRMAYARPEMAGMWSSQDVLKVDPEPAVVQPGFLYALLSSRFGVPLIAGGTYGAIIPHLEPQHIADIPVPLAPAAIQGAAHRLVTEAAELRTKASAELRSVIREIEDAAGLPAIERRYYGESPDVSVVTAGSLNGRMDGLFHSNYHRSVLGPLMGLPSSGRTTVRDLSTRVFEPLRFKRISVEEPAYGVPFFGTSALMRADPDASYLLAKRTPGIDDLTVTRATLLVPRSGQLVGLIGHAVLPHGDVLGGAVSEDAIRVVAPDEGTAGYLYACLSSEYGRRQLKARAFGSSIPHLDVHVIGDAVVPCLDDVAMKRFGARAFGVASARHEALGKEREARALVEQWIETKGGA